MVTPSEIWVSLYDTISVTCSAEGGPNNNFIWSTRTTSGDVTFHQNDAELVIKITEFDEIVYICHVENSAGYEEANLTVYSKFNILCTPINRTLYLQLLQLCFYVIATRMERFQLDCCITEFPIPSVV